MVNFLDENGLTYFWGKIDSALNLIKMKIDAIRVTTVDVTLAPSKVAGYVSSMPRLLTNNVIIRVTAGTITSKITLSNFYGSGYINLTTASGEQDVTLSKGISIDHCCVDIQINNFSIMSDDTNTIQITYGSLVRITGCTITSSMSEQRGVSAGLNSNVYIVNCYVLSLYIAFLASHLSTISIMNTICTGNDIGGQVWAGGSILLGGSTPSDLGGTHNAKDGGLIANADGTLL